MWPAFRQVLLNSIQTIQDFYQTHSRFTRNVGLAGLIAGTAAGALVFLLALMMTGNLIDGNPNLIMLGLFTGITPGIQISILAGSLIAIHLYKGSLPANGALFVSGIPTAAWNLFTLGSFILLALFGIHQVLEQMKAERTNYENFTQLDIQLYHWIMNTLQLATLIIVPFIAIRIYLKGIGHRFNSEMRNRYIASAVILYFWIQTLQTLAYLINQFVTTPIALAISSETIQYLLMTAVTVFVYLFGMLPAAAITSSIVAPETDIQFEGETEMHQ